MFRTCHGLQIRSIGTNWRRNNNKIESAYEKDIKNYLSILLYFTFQIF
ncbi:hypothetical protein SAMN05421847_2946 [Halpernia humi]|uniref:Uncharacterized protein n=1 Tax=Halpernia humi TaxID=493375 RepID=A0A1H6BJZ6_9FLAO|nr:hypothetical protein SAMN05421847_2946 [Halpernia humi]